MTQLYRTHHWSVRQHRDQVRGRAGGLTTQMLRRAERTGGSVLTAEDIVRMEAAEAAKKERKS